MTIMDVKDMNLPTLIREELKDLRKRKEDLEQEKQELMQKTVDECDHSIIHIRKLPQGSCPVAPPWLICSACGYTEEGWTVPEKLYHAYHVDVPKISRRAWLNMRTIQLPVR